MATFCPPPCAEPEFATGLCSRHYSEWIALLSKSSLEERKRIEQEMYDRIAELRNGERDGRSVARLKRGGVPAALIPALRALQKTATVELAQQLGRGELPLLLLLGKAGTGKSVALACACAEVARRWQWDGQPGGGRPMEPFQFIHASALEGFDGMDRRDTLVRCHLLVVDEMGREADAAVQRLVDLIIQRHGAGRPTGMASNLRTTAWKTRFGEPLADRIRADGRAVSLAHESMRSEK